MLRQAINTLADNSARAASKHSAFSLRAWPSARTVNLSHLACEMPSEAQITSNYHRLQRFFQHVNVDVKNQISARRSRVHRLQMDELSN